MDLVQWLGAQLDKDERITREAINLAVPVPGAMSWRSTEGLPDDGGNYWCITTTPPDERAPTVELVGSGMSGGGVHGEALALHIAEHDPARVLREIEAKRRIMECHEPWAAANSDTICGRCGREHIDGRPGGHFPCQTLRLLALPYADRDGYQADWAPTD